MADDRPEPMDPWPAPQTSSAAIADLADAGRGPSEGPVSTMPDNAAEANVIITSKIAACFFAIPI